MKTIKHSVLILSLALALTGCESTKETLGLSGGAPDEFAIVKNDPLVLPPDFALRPPQPGAERPNSKSAATEARQMLFNDASADDPVAIQSNPALSGGENQLLLKAGALNNNSAIRQIVDREAGEQTGDEQTVSERLIGWKPGGGSNEPGTVVDAPAELKRLQENKASGESVTAGETPNIE